MSDERKERKVIAYSDSHAYFIPGEMDDNSSPGIETIDIGNVWTGLQWYQAYNNDTGPLSRKQKADLILEIFKEPNDLIGLARTVELQTGTEGLMQAVVESYAWAEWRIRPHLHDVTERVYFKPNIDVGILIGDNLIAFSEYIFRIETEDDLKTVDPNQNVNLNKIKVDSQFRVIKDGEDIWDEDEHGFLPDFRLRFIEVLPGKKIRLEGDDLDDEETTGESERLYYSYILTSEGGLEFDTRTRTDRISVIKKMVEESEKPIILSRQELKDIEADRFDWNEIRKKISDDQMARKSLAYFLLPYCDMPTTDGHYYVLPEEVVND